MSTYQNVFNVCFSFKYSEYGVLVILLLLILVPSACKDIDVDSPSDYIQQRFYLLESDYFNQTMLLKLDGTPTEGVFVMNYMLGSHGGNHIHGRYAIDTQCKYITFSVHEITKEHEDLPNYIIKDTGFWWAASLWDQFGDKELEFPVGPYHLALSQCSAEGFTIINSSINFITLSQLDEQEYDLLNTPFVLTEDILQSQASLIRELPLAFNYTHFYRPMQAPYLMLVELEFGNSMVPLSHPPEFYQLVPITHPKGPVPIYIPDFTFATDAVEVNAYFTIYTSISNVQSDIDGRVGLSGPFAMYCIQDDSFCEWRTSRIYYASSSSETYNAFANPSNTYRYQDGVFTRITNIQYQLAEPRSE